MRARLALAGRAAGVAISAALIGGLVMVCDLGALSDALDGHGPALLLAAIGLYLVNGVLKAARWCLLLRSAGVAAPLADAYRAFLVGMAVNNLLPTGLAGEPVRLARLQGAVTPEGVAATAADRALDVAVLGAAAAAGIPLLAGLDPGAVPTVAAAAGLCAMAVVLVAVWLGRRGRLAALAHNPASGAGAALLTAAIQLNDPLRLILLASAYGVDLGLWRAIAVIALATVAGAVAVVGGGAGTAVSIGALLAAMGAPADAAAALGLVFVATSAWLSFPLGALAALAGRRVPRHTEARWT